MPVALLLKPRRQWGLPTCSARSRDTHCFYWASHTGDILMHLLCSRDTAACPLVDLIA
jgi:hypothetical protein